MRKVALIVCLCVITTTIYADIDSQPYIASDNINGWSPSATAMTETAPGSGIWTYTRTGLESGFWEEFKITDGSWDTSYPTGNSWYEADANGEVTITFDTNTYSDGWLPAQYRIGVSTEPGEWSLVGNYLSALGRTDWVNDDPTQTMTLLTDGVYYITQTLPAGGYDFKPTQTGTWNAIGTDGRSVDASNYTLGLASSSEVTVYVNAYDGTMGIGGEADLAFLYQAGNPDPMNGAVVGTDVVTALRWSNPEPNDLSDDITCDVYFLDAGTSELTEDPNMGPDLTDAGVVQIADDITAEELDLTAVTPAVLPLEDDHYYYWAVHCTDPGVVDSNGIPQTTNGEIWEFFTGDATPVVDKPADQYMYLAQDDSDYDGGENDPKIRWFEVTASYTDDGKSEITNASLENLEWGWDPNNGEWGVEKVSETWTPGAGVHTSGEVTAVFKSHYVEGDPNSTTTLPGYWRIRLEVTDGSATVNGNSGIYRIFETCGEAAYADPDDDYNGYYDTNSDCIINVYDFADFASHWLNKSAKHE